MGSIQRRKGKVFLRYVDSDGTQRTKLARGATTIAQAKPMLAAIELRLQRGEVGIQERVEETAEQKRRRTITVEQLGELFLKEYTSPKRIKDLRAYRSKATSMLKVRVNPLLGSRRVAALTAQEVKRARDAWLDGDGEGEDDGLSGSSVRQTLALLSVMLVWARDAGYIDTPNVATAKLVERPPVNESLDYLSREEITILLDHLGRSAETGDARLELLHAMVATAVFSGMRKGELFGLHWLDVHDEAQRIDVMRSYAGLPKSGKTRSVPLHPELAPILRRWRDRCPSTPAGLVFPVRGRMGSQYETLDLADEYALAGCHMPAKVWHCLRHTFASHAVMAGASLYDVQKLLGHSTPTMTQIYAKLAPDHLLAQVARMTFARPATPGVADITEERRQRAIAAAADGTGMVREDTQGAAPAAELGIKLA